MDFTDWSAIRRNSRFGLGTNSAVASRSALRAAKCPKKQASKAAQRPCLDTQLDEVDLSVK